MRAWKRLSTMLLGFFYDSSTDDYKVMTIRSWLEVSRIKLGQRFACRMISGSYSQGPTVNERVHWLVTKRRTCNTGFGDTIFLVMGFDPHANEFVQVPMPMPQAMPQSQKEKPVLGLRVLDGCLSLAFCTDCIYKTS